MNPFNLPPAEPVPEVPELDLTWFYVAIDRNRIGCVIAAAPAFFELDIFPSPDAEECGIHVPPEYAAAPGLYRVSPVRFAGALDDDGGFFEVSGDWAACFVIPETAHGA